MARDIKMLLKCDSICMLDDWKQSKGAKLEYTRAKAVKKTACIHCGSSRTYEYKNNNYVCHTCGCYFIANKKKQ